jgi:hypothetical protein
MIAAAIMVAPFPVLAQSSQGQTPSGLTPSTESPGQVQNQDQQGQGLQDQTQNEEERQREGEQGQMVREGQQGQGLQGQEQQGGGMDQQTGCPTDIMGTTVVVEDAPGGLVLAFANTAGQEEQVQESVQGLSEFHNGHNFTGTTEGVPSFSTVEETEFGARLTLIPANPSDREQLRQQLETVVTQMQSGACPMIAASNQPGQIGQQRPTGQTSQPGGIQQGPGQTSQPGGIQPGPGQTSQPGGIQEPLENPDSSGGTTNQPSNPTSPPVP